MTNDLNLLTFLMNIGGVCEKVDCVKGKCVETGELLGLGFKCVCDPGWTQMQLGPLALPACTLPNCESLCSFTILSLRPKFSSLFSYFKKKHF